MKKVQVRHHSRPSGRVTEPAERHIGVRLCRTLQTAATALCPTIRALADLSPTPPSRSHGNSSLRSGSFGPLRTDAHRRHPPAVPGPVKSSRRGWPGPGAMSVIMSTRPAPHPAGPPPPGWCERPGLRAPRRAGWSWSGHPRRTTGRRRTLSVPSARRSSGSARA